MNPTRKVSYQIRECIRLASYLSDGARLYSNPEIAEKLGEDAGWVASVLHEHGGHDSPLVVWDVRDVATNMSYDTGPARVRPVDGIGPPTNMTYDAGKRWRSFSALHSRRHADACGGTNFPLDENEVQ